jgi:hypothetical protein
MISGSASGVWTCYSGNASTNYPNINNSPPKKYWVLKEADWVYDGRNIFKGPSKVTSIKYGTKDVKYVYVGDTCVYEYNTGVQTIEGSSYLVSHAFMGNNDTLYLSTIVDDITSAINYTHERILYEGFYIKPSLYKNGSAVNTTSSNFTIDAWIKDVKLGRSNYTDFQMYYYEDPDNVVGVYVRSGLYRLKDFIDTDDETTRVREGVLLLFNLSQFSLQDSKPSTSPNGSQPLPQNKPLYRIQVSNTLDSLVVVGESGTRYTTYV